MGVVVRRYIDLILLIPTLLVSVLFFAAASPSFCSFFYVLQFDFTRKLVLLTIMFHGTDSNVRILVFVISIQGCQQFQLKYPVLIIKYPNIFFVYTLPLWYSVLLLPMHGVSINFVH